MKRYTVNNYTFDIIEEIESLIEQGLIEAVVIEDDGDIPSHPYIELRANSEKTTINVNHFVDKFNNIVDANKHAVIIANYLKIPYKKASLTYREFVTYKLNEWQKLILEEQQLPDTINQILEKSYHNYNYEIPDKDTVFEGTVSWFNAQKGYGFIKADDGDDVFVSFLAIISYDKIKILMDGERVSFKKYINESNQKIASEVRKI